VRPLSPRPAQERESNLLGLLTMLMFAESFVAVRQRCVAFAAICVALAGCGTSRELVVGPHQGPWYEFSGIGTIRRRVFPSHHGGGTFGILAGDGSFYRAGLPAEFERDGLRVRFRTLRSDEVSRIGIPESPPVPFLTLLEIESLSQEEPLRYEGPLRELTGTGTIQYRTAAQMFGYGRFGILGDNGLFYFADLPSGFGRDGLRVRFRAFAAGGMERNTPETREARREVLVVEIERLSE